MATLSLPKCCETGNLYSCLNGYSVETYTAVKYCKLESLTLTQPFWKCLLLNTHCWNRKWNIKGAVLKQWVKTFGFHMKEKNLEATGQKRIKTLIKSHILTKKKKKRKMTNDTLRSQSLGITENLRLLFWQGWYFQYPRAPVKVFSRKMLTFVKMQSM